MLLNHAEQLYTFAVNATGGKRPYSSSISASISAAYNSTTYMPDLALAAAFLARAERSSNRWNEAVNWYQSGNLTQDLQDEGAVFNWASKSAAVPILLTQMALSSASGGQGEVGGNQQTWQGEAEKWADGVVNGIGQSKKTSGDCSYLRVHNGVLMVHQEDCCIILQTLKARA
jgi:endoglucanase